MSDSADRFEITPHLTFIPSVDDDVVEALSEGDYSTAVTFFLDDGAMDHGEDVTHSHQWHCVVRVRCWGGYAEVPFVVSPDLVRALKAVTSLAEAVDRGTS